VLEINDVRYRQKYVHYYRKLLHPQIAVLYCWHTFIISTDSVARSHSQGAAALYPDANLALWVGETPGNPENIVAMPQKAQVPLYGAGGRAEDHTHIPQSVDKAQFVADVYFLTSKDGLHDSEVAAPPAPFSCGDPRLSCVICRCKQQSGTMQTMYQLFGEPQQREYCGTMCWESSLGEARRTHAAPRPRRPRGHGAGDNSSSSSDDDDDGDGGPAAAAAAAAAAAVQPAVSWAAAAARGLANAGGGGGGGGGGSTAAGGGCLFELHIELGP
jgi:hypothetical protein